MGKQSVHTQKGSCTYGLTPVMIGEHRRGVLKAGAASQG